MGSGCHRGLARHQTAYGYVCGACNSPARDLSGAEMVRLCASSRRHEVPSGLMLKTCYDITPRHYSRDDKKVRSASREPKVEA